MTNKFDRIQENVNTQYIIRNCPAYDCSIVEWNCLGSDATECKNGNCILKQIVELCREENYAWLAKEILQKLDIQEVE